MPNIFSDLILLNNELDALLDNKLASGLNYSEPKQLFTTFIIAKGRRTHEAIVLLCKNGFGEDAFMLSRTLFELMIIFLYILADKTDQRLTRYMEYDHITRKKLYDHIATKPELLKDKRATPEVFQRIQTAYDEVKENYEKPFTWSDKSIAKMSEEVGREEAYRTVYKLQCILSHSESRSINEYFKEESDGSLAIDVGAKTNLIEHSLITDFDFFFSILENANEVFKFGLESEFEKVSKKYADLLNSNRENKIPF
jgi:hypothetical protein